MGQSVSPVYFQVLLLDRGLLHHFQQLFHLLAICLGGLEGFWVGCLLTSSFVLE